MTSWLNAAVEDWKYPVSREWLVMAHSYDLQQALNTKKGSKPKPYPTPWPDANTQKIGSKKLQRRVDVEAALKRMNPKDSDA